MADITKLPFGKTSEGQEVFLFTLENLNGMKVSLTDYGATLVSLVVADKQGNFEDVVLGFDDVQGYQQKCNPYFGATIGRVGNRTAGSKFKLDGVEYHLTPNEGENQLHGGLKGFDKVLWSGEAFEMPGTRGVTFSYLSKDGEEGYPGNLDVKVSYELTDANELKIRFRGNCDKPTPVNLTHHSYFNLKGHGKGDVLDHNITIYADRYTPVDQTLIPTGEIAPVQGTGLDFRVSRRIGDRIEEVGGYDHNYVLNKGLGGYSLAASVYEPVSGRTMLAFTTEPGMQFYTGNYLDDIVGKSGAVYGKQGGLCLEPQHYPDALNKPKFPSIILRPGRTYVHDMAYVFGAK